MPDRETVLKGLECCLGSNDCDVEPNEDCPYKGMCLCAMTLHLEVLALLKEHEFAEPDQAEHIVFGTNRKCSNCGKYLFPAGKFCPHCGQAVKWE